MQLNGIGSGHGAETHHVTSCMHDHAKGPKNGGAAAKGMEMSAQAFQAESRQAETQFSLSAWLQRTLNRGKRLWGNIWGGEQPASLGEIALKSAEEQLAAQADLNRETEADTAGRSVPQQNAGQALPQKLHTPQIAAAATAMAQPQDLQNNPYFAAVEKMEDSQGNLWQRMRVKFRNAAGQLAGHLPGKFFGAQTKSSFQAGQERHREDLRKKSKFRRDEIEIDCVLTDDSYLLDSYDRKGEYSKLSAK